MKLLTPHPSLLTAAAVLLLLAAHSITAGIDLAVETLAEREAAPSTIHHPPSTHHLELDLRDCSPARVELSPIVYVAITTHPGADPDILGCSRYAVIPAARRRP